MAASKPSMIFYERPVLLNRDAHRKAMLGSKQNAFFAAKSNSFLLAAQECVDAMRDYPILFVGNPGGMFTLCVLVGLATDQNLFVTADGRWRTDKYLPGFVRRYPFVLVEQGDSDLQIAIDETCAWANLAGLGTEGERLFTDEGENTPFMDDVATFLLRFHRGMEESREFATRLHQLELLIPRVVEVKSPAGVVALEGFCVVDEARLAALPAATLKEFEEKGYLAWIHFHLASLANIGKLAALADQVAAAQQLPPPPVPQPA